MEIVIRDQNTTDDNQDQPKNTRTRANTHDMVKQAIQPVLGNDNIYLQRLLGEKLEDKEHKFNRIPLTKLVHGTDRSQLRESISNAAQVAQKAAIDALNEKLTLDIENSPGLPQLTLG